MYSGEFTIELINRGRYQCEYCGTPRNITHTVFAGDKKTATKIFFRLYQSRVESGGKGRAQMMRKILTGICILAITLVVFFIICAIIAAVIPGVNFVVIYTAVIITSIISVIIEMIK